MTFRSMRSVISIAFSPVVLSIAGSAQALNAKSMPSEMHAQIGNLKGARILPHLGDPKILGLATSGADLTGLLSGIGVQNQCLYYAYDKNGNRTSQNSQGFGAAIWGSSTYGCFNWTAP